ncbi:topoisomerase C-terminal repeat-containing protein [Lysinibacillus sp. MHQ-1]|nr:topoisomerase C-terminal repeat-containing protein [Lysinibacillus sp. MHQ-1]
MVVPNIKKLVATSPFFKTIAKKELSNKQVRDLIEKGQTGVVKGLKSKEDKEFAAILKLKPDGKIDFIFPQNPMCPKCKKRRDC